MPDFGLAEALSKALESAKGAKVMRPGEAALAAKAGETAPAASAPVVPGAAPEAAPSAQAPSATPAPGSVEAPPIDPSVPPPDKPVPAATTPDVTTTPTDIAAGNVGGGGQPEGAAAAAEPNTQPLPPLPNPEEVPPANKLLPEATPPPVVQDAQRFVDANIGEFRGKLNMTHMPNLDVMNSPDQVKGAIAMVADDNASTIDQARRGEISDQQLKGLAQDIAGNSDVIKQVLGREFGTAIERPEVILAARMVEQQQVGNILQLAEKVAGGSASSAEIASYEQAKSTYTQYLQQLMGAKAEWGRGGRALQIPVGDLPSQVLDHVANVLQSNNPDMVAEAAALKLAGTPQGVASIVSGMANKSLWARIPGAAFGMMQRIFINGILSGPPTWLKIFTGNNFNMLVNQADLFTAGIGRSVYGFASRLGAFPTAEEGVQLSDAMAHMHGVISSGADALRVTGRVVKTGQGLDSVLRSQENAGTYGSMQTHQIFAQELGDSWIGHVVKGIDAVIDAPGSRAIGGVDEFTKTMGYRGYLTMTVMKEVRARLTAGTLKAGDAEAFTKQMMENPDPNIQQAAETWAHRMTFQSAFPEGGAGEAFQNFLNRAPALRFIFPFMRTATNIFKQGIAERTPFGLFSARLRSQIAAGGFEGDLAKGRIASGTAIGGMLAWMAIHDRITGPAPKDAKERAAWELDGRQENSVRITDPLTGKESWRSYGWFEPLASTASVVADCVALKAYLSTDDDVNTLTPHDAQINDAISHVMASVIQNTGDKTFMQGASAFAEMYNDPQRFFTSWADTTGASMVPYSGALKFARNEQDPYLRQAYSLIDKIKNELPTFAGIKGSQSLPARLDVFGQERTRQGGNEILGPMSPLPGNPSTRDDVTDEIQNIMHQTQEVPISMPSQRLALEGSGKGIKDGSGMRLTTREYNEYTRMSRSDPVERFGGLTFKDQLGKTIASPAYQAATPTTRLEYLALVQRQADKAGRERLYDEDPDFAERMDQWSQQKNRIKNGQ